MTPVTTAPRLTRLSELTHHYRMVGTQSRPGIVTWYGDLGEKREMAIYRAMLWKQCTLTQVTRFPPGERPVLFARIVPGVDPAAAYNGASRFVDAQQGIAGVRVEAARRHRLGRVRT